MIEKGADNTQKEGVDPQLVDKIAAGAGDLMRGSAMVLKLTEKVRHGKPVDPSELEEAKRVLEQMERDIKALMKLMKSLEGVD